MKPKPPFVVLNQHPVFGHWEPLRWVDTDEIVTYDTYSEALHDCRKGSKIVTLEKWHTMQS